MTSCYCDYEGPEFFRLFKPSARKPHRCDSCGRQTIRPGEIYEKHTGKWEGDMCTYKLCQRCIDVRDYVRALVPCFCWCYETLLNDALETAREYAHEAPGLLFGVARRVIRARQGASQHV